MNFMAYEVQTMAHECVYIFLKETMIPNYLILSTLFKMWCNAYNIRHDAKFKHIKQTIYSFVQVET